MTIDPSRESDSASGFQESPDQPTFDSTRDDDVAHGDDAAGEDAQPASDSANDTGDRRRRRRGSRGGRRRRRNRKDGEDAQSGTQLAEAPRGSGAAPREIGFDDVPEPDELDPAGESASEPGDESGPESPAAPKKKSRRRRRRGGKGGERSGAAEEGPVEPIFADEDEDLPRETSAVPRELDALASGEDDDSAAEETVEIDGARDGREEGRKKRRRRGSRGGRRRKQRADEPEAEAPRTEEEPAEVESIPGEDDDLPIREIAPARAGGRSQRKKKRGDKGPARETESDDDDLPVVPESQRNALILVNATDPEEQRVAVVESEHIVDFQMTVRDQDSLVNDIYRGRVVNLEPAIGAAFVDFGQGRNGFLHTSDVLSMYGEKDWSLDKLLSAQIDPEEWDSGTSQPNVGAELADDDAGEEPKKKGDKKHRRPRAEKQRRFRARPRLPITDLLKKGQMVVVQVTKDAIGDKGPTLTTYISIPGRYLVLMPSMSRTGVSRKIEDEKERKRLKRILQSLDVPEGMGVIVRTAGVGHSKAEIKRDLDYLKSAWEAFGNRLGSGHGPAPLYRESDVAIRTMRDLFTPTTKAVIVDDPEVHRHITEFTEKLMPENVERVKLHSGPRPLFQSYGIEPDFERIFSRRIELPSGGSVVFDSAEALVAIDVNSGRTRSDGFDFEEIALKTNLEAVPEIARQIRLRDLGGIIVVDFIDMMKMGNIRTVERAFKEALDHDRARSKIGRISQFGLLELTRQRLGPGIAKKAFHSCPRCRGTGRIRTVNSRAAAILRRLGSAMILKGFSTVEVKAHPEVVAYLKDSCSEYIRALEYRFQREVKLYEAPEQHEDSVLRYLRADGKEVRPGGRRKR